MPDVATPRRQRRAISSTPLPGAAAQPAAVSAPANLTGNQESLQAFLQHLRNVVRMRQYHIVGQLSRVQIVRPEGSKTIDFRKDGPTIAFAAGTEQIVIITEWKGLPPKWDDTEEFCKACLAQCDVCSATGEKVCEGFKCGGSGKIPLPSVACPAPNCLDSAGAVLTGCKQCGGTGIFVAKGDCLMCSGSGKMKCPPCRGTGKRPTGNLGGSTNWRHPECPECHGSKFAHTEIPQDLSGFVNARIGPILALGPIVRFAVESVGGTGTPPQVYDVEADASGQYMTILLEHDQPGAGAFMIGGILKSITRG